MNLYTTQEIERVRALENLTDQLTRLRLLHGYHVYKVTSRLRQAHANCLITHARHDAAI